MTLGLIRACLTLHGIMLSRVTGYAKAVGLLRSSGTPCLGNFTGFDRITLSRGTVHVSLHFLCKGYAVKNENYTFSVG